MRFPKIYSDAKLYLQPCLWIKFESWYSIHSELYPVSCLIQKTNWLVLGNSEDLNNDKILLYLTTKFISSFFKILDISKFFFDGNFLKFSKLFFTFFWLYFGFFEFGKLIDFLDHFSSLLKAKTGYFWKYPRANAYFLLRNFNEIFIGPLDNFSSNSFCQ